MTLTWIGTKSGFVLLVSTVSLLGLGLLPLRPPTQWTAPTTSTSHSPTQSVWCQGSEVLSCAAFTLDNVNLQVQTPFLPARFLVAAPGMIQVATSESQSLSRELSVTAVPFGTLSGTEEIL